MFEPGDLVQVTLDCDIKYFWGKLAIVMQDMGQDITDHAKGNYYKLKFASGKNHIFYDKELKLLSKAGKR
tara:strand:+ start:172 stop:381 length:210 start_codon:yes stop_codon:yes gene_type:complete